jgi:hypothetical protein
MSAAAVASTGVHVNHNGEEDEDAGQLLYGDEEAEDQLYIGDDADATDPATAADGIVKDLIHVETEDLACATECIAHEAMFEDPFVMNALEEQLERNQRTDVFVAYRMIAGFMLRDEVLKSATLVDTEHTLAVGPTDSDRTVRATIGREYLATGPCGTPFPALGTALRYPAVFVDTHQAYEYVLRHLYENLQTRRAGCDPRRCVAIPTLFAKPAKCTAPRTQGKVLCTACNNTLRQYVTDIQILAHLAAGAGVPVSDIDAAVAAMLAAATYGAGDPPLEPANVNVRRGKRSI